MWVCLLAKMCAHLFFPFLSFFRAPSASHPSPFLLRTFRNAKLQGLFSEYFISFAPVFWVDLAFSFSFYFKASTLFFHAVNKESEKKGKELLGVLYPSPNICTLFNPTDCCDGFFPKKNTLLGMCSIYFYFRISCICDAFCGRMQIS